MRSNLIVLAMLGLVAVPVIMKVSNSSMMIGTSVAITTYHNDNTRQGLNAKETTLTLGNVNSRQFGKIFSQPVDGFIYGRAFIALFMWQRNTTASMPLTRTAKPAAIRNHFGTRA